MLSKYHKKFLKFENIIDNYIKYFENSGVDFIIGNRNSIKLFEIDGKTISVKAFKKPNLINKIAYRYFRKSKAKRSFEYASILLEKGIGTPEPIAYFENFDVLGLNESYYVCEHLNCDLTYRELVETDYPDSENILRQFTQFTFDMHQKGIEFLDHSPGNTLIINEGNGKYSFYLVDLNRMKFHQTIDFQTRMKNLSKITPKKEMIAIMSNEYAKLYGEDETKVFETMWQLTSDFQYRFARKKRIKRKLKFWKK
ncbi:Kdo domain containing protein [Flavobacterium ardleyense]|uniref:Kdo domain containing protein n=1 Tax=Flavobacterium ardleyense TaxID=2038737 RepID=A0ABW5Z5L7_9FLAO